MAIKTRLGKLEVEQELADFIAQQTRDLVLTDLPVTAEHALRTRLLPLHHSDPFDRLLIAQALVEGVPVVTNDPQFAQYGVQVIW